MPSPSVGMKKKLGQKERDIRFAKGYRDIFCKPIYKSFLYQTTKLTSYIKYSHGDSLT